MRSATILGRLTSVYTPAARQAAMRGTVEDWATESLLAAREAYKVPESGLRLKSGQKPSDAYLNANLPIVRRRLYQAGVRLAMVLNDSW
jgi:nuclease S1